MIKINFNFVVLSAILVFAVQAESQTKADSQLLAEILKIKAIDNHSHVLCDGGFV